MRRVALFGLLLASLSLTFVAGLWAADLKEEFAKLAAEDDAALLTRDAKFFEEYYGEGYFVGERAQVVDREDYLKEILTRTWATAKATEQRIHPLSDTVLLETGIFTATGKEADGKEFHDHQRYIAAWVKKDGRWVNVAEQSTPIVEASR